MPTCDMCNGDEPNHYEKVYITADDIEAALKDVEGEGISLKKMEMQEAIAERVADEIENEMAEKIRVVYNEWLEEQKEHNI